jgi:hypothetical protein
MYLPHIKKQFDEISIIDTYEEMKFYFLRGFLLFVMADEQSISGGLCLIENDTFIFRRLGVLDGDKKHLKKSAQSAIYYFILRHATEEGFKKVDLMKSRSLLMDGVYRTKREWGAAVYPDGESKKWVYFFNVSRSPQVIKFFEDNPVIIHTKEGLRGLVGKADCLEGSMLSSDTIKDLLHRYHCPGLNGLTVMTPTGELNIP